MAQITRIDKDGRCPHMPPEITVSQVHKPLFTRENELLIKIIADMKRQMPVSALAQFLI